MALPSIWEKRTGIVASFSLTKGKEFKIGIIIFLNLMALPSIWEKRTGIVAPFSLTKGKEFKIGIIKIFNHNLPLCPYT